MTTQTCHSNLIPIALDKAINIVYDIMQHYYLDDNKMAFIYKLDSIVCARIAPNAYTLMFTQQELKVLKLLYDNIPII